jgi:hypothetical protein
MTRPLRTKCAQDAELRPVGPEGVTLPDGNVKVSTDSKVLLVDFNVQQSFGQDAGSSGSWDMHPVMTATDFAMSGNLNVALALGARA